MVPASGPAARRRSILKTKPFRLDASEVPIDAKNATRNLGSPDSALIPLACTVLNKWAKAAGDSKLPLLTQPTQVGSLHKGAPG